MLSISNTRHFETGLSRPAALSPRVALRAERRSARRLTLICAFGLLLAAITPPLGFIAFPQTLRLVGPPLPAYAIVAILLLLPALIGLAAARLGLNRVGYRLRARGDKEHAVAISRVFVGTLLFGYAIGLAEAGPAAGAGCVPLTSIALAVSWGLLLHILARPAGAAWRRYVGLVFDIALISAFLHIGDGAAAAAYPLYLLAICQAGFHLGGAALVAAAALSLAGFVAVAVSTDYWQHQPLLAAGLGLALAIVAILAGGLLRLAELSRLRAAAAESARHRWLSALGRTARHPATRSRPEPATGSQSEAELPPSARAFLSEINDILDLSAIDAGDFSVRTETFDLHLLVNRVMAEMRPEAEAKGLRLALQVDPRLPFQLRGSRQLFARILNNVTIFAIDNCAAGTVRLVVKEGLTERRRLRLSLSVRFSAPAPDIGVVAARFAADPLGEATGGEAHDRGGVALTLATRLAELLGGSLSRETGSGSQRRLAVVLPFEIEEGAGEIGLDLAQRPTLIVAEDSHFAHDLAEPLAAWNADARWIGGFEPALAYLARLDSGERPILIVDGRRHALSAISFVHRMRASCTAAPFVLFIAETAQAAGLGDLAEDEFDGLLPAPLDDDLLGNALHALPLHGNRPPPIRASGPLAAQPVAAPAQHNPPAVAERDRPADDDRITPISAHPRFASDPPEIVDPILDPAAIETLRGLGGGEDFLREVIESFRIEARQIVERLRRAAAAGDPTGFARAAQALRSAAGIVGGARLCAALLPWSEIAADELRDSGAAHLQRLATELAILETALDGLFNHAEAQSQ